MAKNPVAKDLRSGKYKHKVIPDKKKETKEKETYEWIEELPSDV